MKHARPDYERFQDPAIDNPELLGIGSTPIAEDEPVFLLRAKDKHFIPMLMQYLRMIYNDASEEMLDAVNAHIGLAREWQDEHGTKTPDMPHDGAKE
jgi:hypothetical protein